MATKALNDWNNYGGIYVEDGSTAESSSTSTPAKIAAFTTAMPASSNTTVSAANDNITITDAGDYLVQASISFSGGSSDTYYIEIYADTTATALKMERKLGTGGDVGSCSVVGIVTLTAGQAISLYQSTDNTSAMTVTNAQLTIQKIGWQ